MSTSEFAEAETDKVKLDDATNPYKTTPQSGRSLFKNSSDKTTRNIAIIALVISILGFLIGTDFFYWIYKSFPSWLSANPTILEGLVAILNVLLSATVLIDLHIIRPVRPTYDDSPASRSFKQLLRGWRLLWITWILLYICLAINWFHLFDNNKPASVVLKVGADGLNMINGYLFYYLFFVLDQPSVATKSEPRRARDFHRNKYVALSLGIIALAASIILNQLYPADVMSNAEAQTVPSGMLGKKLLAAYTALGMVFFIGRLDSHYLRVSRIILAPLYLYAIIQLFWGHSIFLNRFDVEQVTIFSLALVLKLVIFLALSSWIRDGRFLQYIVDAEKGLRS